MSESNESEKNSELLKENRHLSIQLKEAHEVIKDYQDVAKIRDNEIVDLNVKLIKLKDKTRELLIQHQQLLDKAIDDEITDEDTDGYKESIAILDELRNLIN